MKNESKNGSTASASAGLFEKIDPAKTGVDFRNIIEENEKVNYLTLNHLYLGGAAAVGDFDKNGLPDVFFVSTQGQPKLYLNRGDFHFEDVTEKSGLGNISGLKTGVAVADVDANGWPDIYLCRVGQTPEERGNLLFLNQGSNSLPSGEGQGGVQFVESASKMGLDTKSVSTHATFFDYDLDGDLDCYIINRPANFSSVTSLKVEQINGKLVRNAKPENEFESDRLMQNDNGFFKEVSKKAGIQNRKFSLSMLVQDFNNDGWPDIFVANDYIEPDIFYLNNKDGTFTDHFSEWFGHTSHFSMGSDATDFNGDGHLDLVTLDMNPEERPRQKIMASPMTPDRYNTLVNYGYGHQIMRNMLQMNTGRGSFSEVGCVAGIQNTDWSWSPLAQDFDNDGKRDLFISNGFKRDVNELDFIQFTLDSMVKTAKSVAEIWPVFEKAKTVATRNYMFRNRGDETFEDVGNAWGFAEKTLSNAAIYADFDADGDLDIAINNTDAPAFFYKNKSVERGKTHFFQAKLEGPKGNADGFGAKIRITSGGQNQWTELHPTRGFMSTVEPIVHFGLGQNTSISALDIQWPDGRMQHFDNPPVDKKMVLRWADATGKGLLQPQKVATVWHEANAETGISAKHLENTFNDFNRERLIPHQLSNLGPALAVGDLNGDGLEDFYFGGAFGSGGSVFFQEKTGRFRQDASAFRPDSIYEDTDAVIFDADLDGDNDLFVVSGGNEAPVGQGFYRDRIYINDGKGNLSKDLERTPNEDESGSSVEAFDYDGDGDLDLFVGGRGRPGRYPEASASLILKNEKGHFSIVTSAVAAGFEKLGMVTDLHFADLDGDSKKDILVASEWGPISVFRNLGGGKFEAATTAFGLEKTEGWWASLASGDFDGDGDMDFAAGNFGLNSRYLASETKPLELFSKDFDANGSLDPVICQWDKDQLTPVAYRDQMLKQLPSLKKKFVRNAGYSTATIQQLFSKYELDGAAHFFCRELASCWFENKKGRFEKHVLPVAAQAAPIRAWLVDDFDGDGKIDLLGCGNDFGFEVESGRQDAGTGFLLKNDGKGNFAAESVERSGLLANLDARRTAFLKKANGSKLILVANNSGKLQVFSK